MPQVNRYTVQYQCHRCGAVHAVSGDFLMPGGPAQAGSLDELYPAGDLPSVLQRLLGELVWCDDAAEYIELEDPARVYLIPEASLTAPD